MLRVLAETYLRRGRRAYASCSSRTSCASRAISSRCRTGVGATCSCGCGSARVSRCCETVASAWLAVVMMCGPLIVCCAGAAGDISLGATPDWVTGSGPEKGAPGRCALSLLPPPALLACARKSAFAGVSALDMLIRVTSSVGRLGAGFAKWNPMPRIRIACSINENSKAAPKWLAPKPVASVDATAFMPRAWPRSRRTPCPRC